MQAVRWPIDPLFEDNDMHPNTWVGKTSYFLSYVVLRGLYSQQGYNFDVIISYEFGFSRKSIIRRSSP